MWKNNVNKVNKVFNRWLKQIFVFKSFKYNMTYPPLIRNNKSNYGL